MHKPVSQPNADQTLMPQQKAGENEPSSLFGSSLFYFFSLIVIGSLTAVTAVLWDSVEGKIFLVALLLLFSVLFIWSMSLDGKNTWKMHLYLAAQTLLVSLLLTQNRIFAIQFYILSAQTMMVLRIRPSVIWISVFALITLGSSFYWRSGDSASDALIYNAVVRSAGFFLFGVVGHMITQVRQTKIQNESLLTELMTLRSRLNNRVEEIELVVATEERARLSRELHDGLGHRLTVSIVHLEGVLRLMKRESQQVEEKLQTVHTQLTEGLKDLRHIIKVLAVPQITSKNLLHSLQQLIDQFAVGASVHLHVQLPDMLPHPLSNDICLTTYRAAQEALTNSQKHAQAQSIWLTLDVTDHALILTIRNDGRDFSSSNGYGHGLRGMHERATQIGGVLHVTRPAEGGILLTLSLPIQEKVHV